MNYVRIVKAAAAVERAKNDVVELGQQATMLRMEPDPEKSKKVVEKFLAAQERFHRAIADIDE